MKNHNKENNGEVCLGCFTEEIIGLFDDYEKNRYSIIELLWNYGKITKKANQSDNKFLISEPVNGVDNESAKGHARELFHKLSDIEQMISQNISKDDILEELQILELNTHGFRDRAY